MDDQKELEGWPERFTAGIAAQIRRYREAKGWSFQQLADACTDRGYRTLRTTLANLENGRRKSITVHELVVIADALDVPAVELLFPGLPEGDLEYLPGRTSIAWQALRRFTGETGVPGQTAMRGQPGYHLSLMRQIDYNAARVAELWSKLSESQREYALAMSAAESDNPPPDALRSALSYGAVIRQIEREIDDLRNTEQLLRDVLAAAGFTLFNQGGSDG